MTKEALARLSSFCKTSLLMIALKIPGFARAAGSRILSKRKEIPTFATTISLVIVVGLIVGCLSIVVNSNQRSQINSQEKTLRDLRANGNTIRGQLTQLRPALDVIASERQTPHPVLADRDAQLIGEHVDVSWTDDSQARFANPLYIVSITKIARSATNQTNEWVDCFALRGDEIDPKTAESGCEDTFVASDSIHRTTRIPTDARYTLRPGHYVWKVVAVSSGNLSNDDPDITMLSKWSNYGSFTLFDNLNRRVAETGRVLVGVNLEQNSRFARTEGGRVMGTDVDLVSLLVQACLKIDGTNAPRYVENRCTKEAGRMQACIQERVKDPRGQSEDCAAHTASSEKGSLRVKFVPLPAWGDWQKAIRRKEIDLFIGGLTAARAREGGGVKFVSGGYRSYQSHFYFNRADILSPRLNLWSWTSTQKKVGVIESSSNEALLDFAIDERCTDLARDRAHNGPSPRNACPLVKIVFKDYPELDRGMDGGGLDAVLIDDTFVVAGEWKKSPDVPEFAAKAWQLYEKHFLGEYGVDHQEHLSFAAADDTADVKRNTLRRALKDAIFNRAVSAFLQTEADLEEVRN